MKTKYQILVVLKDKEEVLESSEFYDSLAEAEESCKTDLLDNGENLAKDSQLRIVEITDVTPLAIGILIGKKNKRRKLK